MHKKDPYELTHSLPKSTNSNGKYVTHGYATLGFLILHTCKKRICYSSQRTTGRWFEDHAILEWL